MKSFAENLIARLSASWKRSKLTRLYKREDYLDAYIAHTDSRVQIDPHGAVGGKWEELGNLQFEFLVRNGLQPQHTLLDIGCGTLRGGRHFIRHLNPTNYSGMDISPKAIEYSRQIVAEEGLTEKKPRLLVSRNKNLQFREFEGEVFDFLLAQSVFTHLKPEHIDECFRHIGQVMSRSSKFFFTFFERRDFKQIGVKDFVYPSAFFQTLADEHGFKLEDLSQDYDHPRRQSIAMISKESRQS